MDILAFTINILRVIGLAFAILVLLKIVTGHINIKGLISTDTKGSLSIGRLQLLMTMGFIAPVSAPAATMLETGDATGSVMTLLIAMGASQGVYLSAKATPSIKRGLLGVTNSNKTN